MAVSSTPVLYVATSTTVYAYNPTDSGSTAPSRTITLPSSGATNVAITAYLDGTLDVLQSTSANSPLGPCRVVVLSATANGSTVPVSKASCSDSSDYFTSPQGIATNSNGGIDILGAETSGTLYINHITQSNDGNGTLGTPGSLLELGPGTTPAYLATDPQHDYTLTAAGTVSKYSNTASGTGADATPAQRFHTNSGTGGPLAVSPVDKTLYLVEPNGGTGSTYLIAGFMPSTYQGNSGTPTPDYTLDLGSNVTGVQAIACDSSGNVYIALTNGSGSHVRVYASHLGAMSRVLNVSGTPVGVALYQPSGS